MLSGLSNLPIEVSKLLFGKDCADDMPVPIEMFTKKLKVRLGKDSVEPIALSEISVIEVVVGAPNTSSLKIELLNSK
jgi:hypothetical protein